MTAHLQESLRSAAYECSVWHERSSPSRHAFRYRLFYLAIDLDELGALTRRLRLLSINRRNVLSLREADFLPLDEPPHRPKSPVRAAPAATLRERALAVWAAHGVAFGPRARVTLVTVPRYLGYQFNPVSFYFCHDADGVARGAIAEVTNTFREVKLYVLRADGDGGRFQRTLAKDFYVSPFSPAAAAFAFDLRAPGDRLAVVIDHYLGSERTLHAALTGRRVALTDATLLRLAMMHPFVSAKVITMIHWQALRLWAKRVPFFRKAAAPERQTDLYRPHASLKAHRP